MLARKTIKSILLAVIPACLSGTPVTATPFGQDVISISEDGGGRIGNYVNKVNEAGRVGSVVRFTGRCDSACTLFLALPPSKTCIAPGAMFRFHQPTGGTASANREGARYMIQQYPGWVRKWIASNGGLSERLITMDYAYARRHLRPCEVRERKLVFAFNYRQKNSNPFLHRISR